MTMDPVEQAILALAGGGAGGAPQDRTAFNPATGNIEYQAYNPATQTWEWTGVIASRPPAGNTTIVNASTTSPAATGSLTRAFIEQEAARLGGTVKDYIGGLRVTFPDGNYVDFNASNKDPSSQTQYYNPGNPNTPKGSEGGTGSIKLNTFLEKMKGVTAGGTGATTTPPPATAPATAPAATTQPGRGDPLGPGYQQLFAKYGIGSEGGVYPTFTRNAFTDQNELSQLNVVTPGEGGTPGGAGSMTQHIDPETLISQLLPMVGMKPTGNLANDLQSALEVQAFQKAQWALPGATSASVSAASDFLADQKAAERNRRLNELLGIDPNMGYGVSGQPSVMGFAGGGDVQVNPWQGARIERPAVGVPERPLRLMEPEDPWQPQSRVTLTPDSAVYNTGGIPGYTTNEQAGRGSGGGISTFDALLARERMKIQAGGMPSPWYQEYMAKRMRERQQASQNRPVERNPGLGNDVAPLPGVIPNIFPTGGDMTTSGPVGIFELRPDPITGVPMPTRPLAIAGGGGQQETISIDPRAGNNIPRARAAEQGMARKMGGGQGGQRMTSSPAFLQALAAGIRRRQRLSLPVAAA